MNEHILLIGFMGSGKSTIGYRLSCEFKRRFLDTDKLIEQMEGMTITALFAQKGEAYFREKETECLKGLSKEPGSRIIALGGGTPMRENNQELIKRLGTVVYLKASGETVYNRLKKDKTRPLLQCENPKERICALIAERGPVYEKLADIVITVDDKQMFEIVKEIREAFTYEDISD